MGQSIGNGAAIYRESWDIKQPGWPLWFMAAGKTFGFTEVGVHLVELFHLSDRERVSSALTRPGDIYEIGNPLQMYLLGRSQAIQLEIARPPYLMIEDDYRRHVAERPAFEEFVLSRYRVLMATRDGVWYEAWSDSG